MTLRVKCAVSNTLPVQIAASSKGWPSRHLILHVATRPRIPFSSRMNPLPCRWDPLRNEILSPRFTKILSHAEASVAHAPVMSEAAAPEGKASQSGHNNDAVTAAEANISNRRSRGTPMLTPIVVFRYLHSGDTCGFVLDSGRQPTGVRLRMSAIGYNFRTSAGIVLSPKATVTESV